MKFAYIRLGFYEGEIFSLLEQGPEAVVAAYHQFDGVYKDRAVIAACWKLVLEAALQWRPWSNQYDSYAHYTRDQASWQWDVDAINQAAAEMGASDAHLVEDWHELATDVFYGLHGHEDPDRVDARWEERHAND